MSHHNVTQREGDIFSRPPLMKESTKYWIYSWVAIASFVVVLVTCIYALFR